MRLKSFVYQFVGIFHYSNFLAYVSLRRDLIHPLYFEKMLWWMEYIFASHIKKHFQVRQLTSLRPPF